MIALFKARIERIIETKQKRFNMSWEKSCFNQQVWIIKFAPVPFFKKFNDGFWARACLRGEYCDWTLWGKAGGRGP